MGSADDLRTSVAQSSGRAADRVSMMTNDARERFGTGREYAEDRVRENPVYFGIAALAIGAAAGIGLMQRNKPEEYQRASYVDERIISNARTSASSSALLRRDRQFWYFAAGSAAAPRLFRYALAAVEHVAVEQPLDQRDAVHDRIIAPDLALHRFRRAAAMQRDHRVPAGLV